MIKTSKDYPSEKFSIRYPIVSRVLKKEYIEAKQFVSWTD